MNPDFSSFSDRAFAGGGFHPDLPGGQATGLVRLSAQGARFESEQGAFELPREGLKITLGGHNDSVVFLTHPAFPKASIHTTDRGLLEHPLVRGDATFAAQRGTARTRQRSTTLVLFSLAAVVVLGVVALVLGRGWLVARAADAVPVAWEVKAGDALFTQMMAGKRELADPALAAQLRQLTEPLVQGIADKRYPLTFHIIEDASLNAFAMPGGHVVLHSGLLLAAETPEEVAGVLAHEIAHVTRRHGIRNIISSAGLYLVISAVIGDVSGLLGILVDNSALLLDRKFSRDFEREADEVGWDYLLASRIRPEGMIAFFKRMQAEEAAKAPGGMPPALDLVSTHPATGERIARLERKRSELGDAGDFPPLPVDYAAFKDALRQQLHDRR